MIEALLNSDLLWRDSAWLWGLGLPIVMWAIQRLLRNRQKQSYADAALWPWVSTAGNAMQQSTNSGFINRFTRPGKLITANRLLILAWICLVIAVAGPRSLDTQFESQARNGVDVMIDFDISQSMTAEDVKPNRFLFAKSIAQSLVNGLENNDRVALSVFGGQPHSVLPLTYDKQVFNHSLNLIEPGLLPTKGSWLELGLIGALNTLTEMGRKAKILVIFTNGAPPFWKPVKLPKIVQSLKVTQSQAMSQTGVKVIFVGVGKTRPVPIPDKSNPSGHLHANGLLVQSRLEEGQLLTFAQKTEGLYLHASTDQAFMNKLQKAITDTASSYQDKTFKQVWVSYAQPFTIIGLASLLLAFYLWQMAFGIAGFNIKGKSSKDKIAQNKIVKSSAKSGFNQPLILMLMLPIVTMAVTGIWPKPAMAEQSISNPTTSKLHQAYTAFEGKSFELAQSLYDEVSSYKGWFGAGASAYKAEDLDSAVLYFRQAAWQAPNNIERAKALYNLGNSYYLANLLPQAIDSYKQAMLYQSPYAKAEHNLAIAKQRNELEKQAKKPKSNKQKKGKGSQGDSANGAFYGGQKPSNSKSKKPGSGMDGDSPKGGRSGKLFKMPEHDTLTNYKLNPSIAKLRLNTVSDSSSNSVLRAQVKQQRAEKFAHKLQSLQDDQKQLLKRLFEREEGFHAAQKEPHAIPGIQPW